MKRSWIMAFLGSAALCWLPQARGAENFLLYHEKLATPAEQQEIRADSARRFEALTKSVAATRRELKTEKLPPLVRERTEKRFQICDRLVNLIKIYSKPTIPEYTFHVKRMVDDLEVFDQYFKDELAYGRKVAAFPKAKVFSVKDFGAKGDGVTDDTDAVEAAMKEIKKLNGAPAELVFPKGKYRFTKLMHAESTRNLFGERPTPCCDVAKKFSNNHYYTKYVHFLLYDLDNVTVRGETPDTELQFTEPEIGIMLAACNNVTLKDLTVRSAIKTHTQGDLLAVDPKNKTLTIRFDEGYPLPDDPGWKVVSNATAQSYDDKGVIVKGASDILSVKLWDFEKISDRTYKIKYTQARYLDQVPSGVRIAFPLRQDRQSMIVPKRCKFTTFNNVTVLSAGASAMPTAECYVTSFINCRVTPVKGNLMSSAADGSINTDSFFGPYYRGCRFYNFGDDGVNVFGYAGHVLEHHGSKFKIDAHHFWGCEYIAPGETLVFKKKVNVILIDPNTGKIKGVARVVSAKSTPELGKPVYEVELAGYIAHDAIVSAKDLAPDKTWTEYVQYVVAESARRRHAMQGGTTFLKPDHIAFIQEGGIGTVISNCEFANNRHNGITLQTANALIENNKIGGNTDFGVLVTSYYRGLGGWREGGLPYNVVIRRNTFTDTFIALSLWYSIGIGKYSPLMALRDIVFEENTVNGAVRGIDLYNVNGLVVRNNVFTGVSVARSDVSRNVSFLNNLWNGERFAPVHFTKMAKDPKAYTFKTNNPKFEGKAPTVRHAKLSIFHWAKEMQKVKKSEQDGAILLEVTEPLSGDKIHPAFIQAGFVNPGLPAGNYLVTSRVTATQDCEVIAVSEIPKKKAFAQQKFQLKANVPQEIRLNVPVDKASAWQPMRLIYLCLANAPAGTKFEIGRPTIEFGTAKAAPAKAAKPVKLSPFDWSKEKGGLKRTVRKNGMTLEVVKVPAGDKIVPAFLQAGYVSRTLTAGDYLVAAAITADRDCEIIAISEVPGKKGFGQQKFSLKAKVPQKVRFKMVITDALAGEVTRVIYFGLAKAPAGTKFELTLPTVTKIEE